MKKFIYFNLLELWAKVCNVTKFTLLFDLKSWNSLALVMKKIVAYRV